MATTDKYDFETLAYGVTGWSGIVTTVIQLVDEHLHTRILGTAGETISAYEAIHLKSTGKFVLSKAGGVTQPAWGLAVESAVLDGDIRLQRVGDITNAGWSWTGIGVEYPIYLSDATPGALTQVEPALNVQLMGYPLGPTSMFLIGNMTMNSDTDSISSSSSSSCSCSSSSCSSSSCSSSCCSSCSSSSSSCSSSFSSSCSSSCSSSFSSSSSA
jgi:hypothetical protein